MASKKQEGKVAGEGSPTHKPEQQPPPSQQREGKDFDVQSLKDFITQALDEKFQKSQQEMKREINEFKEAMKENYDKVSDKLSNVVSDLAESITKVDSKLEEFKSEVNVKMKDADIKIADVDNKVERVENEITMIQFRSMEFAIRLRGIKENDRQDLRQICSDALAVLLKIDPADVVYKIDKIYRVNSWVARQRKLPRDVVIYFTDRRIRNDILQRSFLSSVQVEGAQIGIYKELPPKMLKDRKEYRFLVNELQKQEIPFRWDAPTGIILKYNGERHRLNTFQKAEYFYYNILKERSSSPRTSTLLEIKSDKEKQSQHERAQQSKQMEPVEMQGAARGGGLLEESLSEPSPILSTGAVLDVAGMPEVKDQRITRAISKQIKEKREAMGGARPKTSEEVRQSSSSLQKGQDDN